MSEQKFQPTVSLRLTNCDGLHADQVCVYGVPDPNMLVDFQKGTLVVPEHPDAEWCALHEGGRNFVMIPVYCDACAKWTIHVYFDKDPRGEPRWHSFFMGWSVFSFMKLIYSGVPQKENGFVKVKVISGLTEFWWGNYNFSMDVESPSNAYLVGYYRALLSVVFRHRGAYKHEHGSRVARAVHKYICAEQKFLVSSVNQNFSFREKLAVFARTAEKGIMELHQLLERDNIKSRSLAEVREALQAALLIAHPQSESVLREAGVPMIKPEVINS